MPDWGYGRARLEDEALVPCIPTAAADGGGDGAGARPRGGDMRCERGACWAVPAAAGLYGGICAPATSTHERFSRIGLGPAYSSDPSPYAHQTAAGDGAGQGDRNSGRRAEARSGREDWSRPRIVVNRHWVQVFPPEEVAAEIARGGMRGNVSRRYGSVAAKLIMLVHSNNNKICDIMDAVAKASAAEVAWNGQALIWRAPVWRGEWAARTRAVTERMHPAEAATVWNALLHREVRTEMKASRQRTKYAAVTWNARHLCAETALELQAWIAQKRAAGTTVGIVFVTETWQLPHEQLPPLEGYETTFAKPRTKYERGGAQTRGGGVAVYVHNSLRHMVTDADRTTSGDYEAALAVRIKNPRTKQSSFVALVYGERKRPAAGTSVTNRDVIETVARWQNELGGHLTVLGDLNVHAGSTEMEEWEATLGVTRLDTGKAHSYWRLDTHRNTELECRTTPDHILVPPARTVRGRPRPITRAQVEHQDLGLHKQDHFPLVSNLHVHVPQMTKRRRKKVVSRLTKMGPVEKALLVSELAGGEAAVHGDIANTVAGAAGLDEAAEAVLKWC